MKSELAIVGAGPAGLTAAIVAAQRGIETLVIERNSTAGRKLLKTGRGRCNLTHEATVEEFVRACEPFGRFLKHGLYTFGPGQVRRFFQEHGLDTKVEPSGCVFPVTDRASDVKAVLLEQAKQAGVRFVYGGRVYRVRKRDTEFVLKSDNEIYFHARSVILATGGVSWPETGSTGDGYAIAASFGHAIIEPQAALIPLIVREPWVRDLQGLGLEQVQIKVKMAGMKMASSAGAMMFTQDGIGGPVVFDLSRKRAGLFDMQVGMELNIDLFVGLDRKPLEQKLIALCQAHPKKKIAGLLCELLPCALSETLCRLADCTDISASQLSKDKRNSLLDLCKALPLHVVSTRPIEEATVTRGGVDTGQIDPETMQSRLCPGLYFAGEVINVDGPCGGYNLQIAFSTGYLAGQSIPSQPSDEESEK